MTRAELEPALESCELLIVGDAGGTDAYAYAYAVQVLGLSIGGGGVDMHYARNHGDWPAAGPLRNSAIVLAAAKCLIDGHDVTAWAYPDAESRGTWDCVRKLRRVGIEPRVIR